MGDIKFTGRIDKASIDALTKKLKKLQRPVEKKEAKEIAETIEKEMKDMIAAGISPIRGMRKMPKYRGSYADQIKSKGYVSVNGRKYSKQMRPVNLYLTGKFLENLKAKIISVGSGYGVSIGYRDKKQQKKEQGHREGYNNQAIRPTIPQSKSGEQFALKIQKAYLNILDRLINKIIKKKM